MAEEFEFLFTNVQIEALARALENCGVNSGSSAAGLEYFRDPQLVTAARSAYSRLKAKGQRQARSKGRPEVIRELTKDSAVADLQKAYRQMKGDYMEVLEDVGQLLAAAREARDALSKKLDVHMRQEDRFALDELERALKRALFSRSAVSDKLQALMGDSGR